MVPTLKAMSADKVPNIRLNVCKTISEIRSKMKEKEEQPDQELENLLQRMKFDDDDDVKYFARRALQC